MREIIAGPAAEPSLVLNPGDSGLLQSLDQLSAAQASRRLAGGYSIAGRVEELRYSLAMFNRWHLGENPFIDSGVRTAGRRMCVNDALWCEQRRRLRHELGRWMDLAVNQRIATDAENAGMMALAVCVAYHLGALRQMHRALSRRGRQGLNASPTRVPAQAARVRSSGPFRPYIVSAAGRNGRTERWQADDTVCESNVVVDGPRLA
jgi:hypothetical protein